MGKLYSVWLKWIQLDSVKVSPSFLLSTLREKCPKTELFLVRIFRTRAEYRVEETPYLDNFHTVQKKTYHSSKETGISFHHRMWVPNVIREFLNSHQITSFLPKLVIGTINFLSIFPKTSILSHSRVL